MAVNNSLTPKQPPRLGLTAYLTQDAVKTQINNVVGGKDGRNSRWRRQIASSCC